MKSISRHSGKLEVIRRLPQSSNGNPRYLLRIAGWTCRTTPDSSLAYEVPNYDGKNVIATIGTYYGLASLHSVREVMK